MDGKIRRNNPMGLAFGDAEARYQATLYAIVTQLPEPAAGVGNEQPG
jgi:hypothetical protein